MEGTKPPRPARIEVIDNWHDQWSDILALVESAHQREALHLDEDGWIPARQNLLVAFKANVPVGFLTFRVGPIVKSGALSMEAVVEGAFVENDEDGSIARQLRESAMHRALSLRCSRFRWDRVEVAR